eukprot:scaffold160739_cov21-Tisochrysis_lutea.AAC.1
MELSTASSRVSTGLRKGGVSTRLGSQSSRAPSWSHHSGRGSRQKQASTFCVSMPPGAPAPVSISPIAGMPVATISGKPAQRFSH